jgi:hypothetical protein
MEIKRGTSVNNFTRKSGPTPKVMFALHLSMDLSILLLVFEVARLNRSQPLFHRVCMEYIDNNAYEIAECPNSKYDMWDCCFIKLLFPIGSRLTIKRAM